MDSRFLFSIFIFLFCKVYCTATPPIKCKIVRSAILGAVPELKLHHVIVMQSTSMKNDVYVIDFSPIHQSSIKTLLRLLLARRVPAETRLRLIKDGSLMNDNELIESWYNTNVTDTNVSQKISRRIFMSIRDKTLKNQIAEILQWDSHMNLYNRNCQHFSRFVMNKCSNK